MQKIGRNDPCPCGSGKKYKKCCGAAGDSGVIINPDLDYISINREIAYTPLKDTWERKKALPTGLTDLLKILSD